MTLDDATEQLEALPGVYEVNMFVPRVALKYVKFCVHCRSLGILPEETRQGILRIRDTLESDFGCVVAVSVSAGLRMPD